MDSQGLEVVELPLYHRQRGNEKLKALVNARYLRPLMKLGKWNLNISYGRVVAAPRTTRIFVNEERNETMQVNFLLHRIVYILEAYGEGNDEKMMRLVSTEEGLDELWTYHKTLPRIKQTDGNFHNCTIENLDASLSPRTKSRRIKSGQEIYLPPKIEKEQLEYNDEARIDQYENLSSLDKVALEHARSSKDKPLETNEDFLNLMKKATTPEIENINVDDRTEIRVKHENIIPEGGIDDPPPMPLEQPKESNEGK